MTPESETYIEDGRVYARPEVPVTETDEFITNLRAVQDANNADIKTQTENLGTDIASVQGGLVGPESYFTSRYQTPQTNQVVSELRSAAQASALNTALSNLQSQYQKRYQDAYRNYQKRASRGSSRRGSGSGGGTSTGSGQNTVTVGEVVEQATDQIAQPDEIMRRIERQKQEEENARKAREYIEEVQQKTEQAINPPTTVLSPQEAIDYWKNLRR